MSWSVVSTTYSKECFKTTSKVAENGTKIKECVKEFEIYLSKDGNPLLHVFKVLPGFLCDGASVPKPLQPILNKPWDSRYIVPYIIHDILYATKYLGRVHADSILADCLQQAGYGSIRAGVVYSGVRVFGGRPWDSSPCQRPAVNYVRKILY
jgi:hypothetical protein